MSCSNLFAMELEFVNSERGYPKLIDGSYLFNKDKTIGSRTFWKCEFYYKHRCPARITTANGKVESRWKSHVGHIQTPANVEAAIIKNKVLHFEKNHLHLFFFGDQHFEPLFPKFENINLAIFLVNMFVLCCV